MTFRRGLLVLAILVAYGVVQVTQQTAIRVLAYEVGKRSQRLHERENETRWLKTQVVALQSPIRLARSLKDQKAGLVAWSALPVPHQGRGQRAGLARSGPRSVSD
ncbi:MAG: hypothetical protein HYZ89_06580 [Candidatus Omnitrophica bacterium]|nr:hypothetical protein [Candidatus Omnitrophota bacterium]